MNPENLRSTISMYTMFQESDLFMKLLTIGLLLASVWCWAIIFDKAITLKRIREGMKAFESKFWAATSLDALHESMTKKNRDPLSQIFRGAYQEYQQTLRDRKKRTSSIKLQERIEKVMEIIIDKQVEKIETRMVFLASTGSAAPLLGLFGTVWGIMDSFNAIGATQSANIAAVAPGVAAALFTTAVGLIAAIPAVIGYNKLNNDIESCVKRMETFSGELGTILARQAEKAEEE